MSESYALSGAVLSCSFGTMTSSLNVTDLRRPKMNSKSQATVSDCKGIRNITSFQMCKRALPNGLIPCVPTTCMKWLNGKSDIRIRGEAVLLTTCIIPCSYGGMIKIEGNG